jgi:hypothetical protein
VNRGSLDVVSLPLAWCDMILGHGHSCRHARPRRAMGGRRAPAPTLTPSPVRRPASHHPCPQLLCRDRVHGPHFHAVAAAAGQGAWLWLTFDLLAPPCRVGRCRIFDQLHLEVLDRLGEQGRVDWSRASVDTMSVRAKRGGITWAQIQSIGASLGASSTWSATAVGCR